MVVRGNRHRTAELQCVALHHPRPVAIAQRADRSNQRLRFDHPADGSLETKKTEGLSLWIGKQGAGISGKRAEFRQLLGLAIADNHQPDAFFGKGRFLLCQFSNLLTAEHSAEMADKDDNGRLILPQRA